MPTYEYACSACNATLTVQQKMTDDSLTVCPDCGEPSLRKLFHNVGVVFKGSGFYRTDSRSGGKSTSSSSGSSSSGSSASSSSSTSSTASSAGSSASGSSAGSSSSSSSSGSTSAS